MSIKPAKVQFNGGELSPWLEGRIDVAQYDKTAKLCRNFIPLAEGCLKRRGGTHFVAMTPEDVDVTLTVVTLPEGAVVVLNGVEGNTIAVERGAEVVIDVTYAGYRPYHGVGVIVSDAVVQVALVAITETCVLEIKTTPEEAVVMIEGEERRRYVAAKNSEVFYKVSHEFYETKDGTVLMDTDKSLNIQLEAAMSSDVYGDWGVPQYFVACTQVGHLKKQYKSFIIRFSHGYLVVLFSSKLIAPDVHYEMWFVYTNEDGYNSVAWKNNAFHLTDLQVASDAFRYKSLDGKLIFAIDLALSAPAIGWEVDEDKHYASYYTRYDGEIKGHIISIKYDGHEVWKIKERTI